MFRLLTSLAVLAGLLLAPPLPAQEAGSAQPIYLTVKVPADAKVWVNGHLTTQTGAVRQFASRAMPSDGNKTYTYTLKATFKGPDGKDVTTEDTVQVVPGKATAVDLAKTSAGQRSTTPPAAATRTPATQVSSSGYYDPGYYGRYYDPTYRPAVGEHYVQGYYRSDGTYVRGHWKTNADDSFWNNYSSWGNVNPHTGKVGTKLPGYSSRYSGR
jgi:uncharacterized protein (TIGR03000 family)